MIIRNAKVFLDGKFVKTDVTFDRIVTHIGEAASAGAGFDAEGLFLIPGLVDIHSHGAVGEDAGDGSVKGLEAMSRFYAKGGVTSWCPTTMTVPEAEILSSIDAVNHFVRPADGARLAGINLEGPFLCYEKRGAQAAENLRLPDIRLFDNFFTAANGKIKLVSVACEKNGAMEFISAVSKKSNVSLGHSIADYETSMKAFASGANHVTHIFNGMSPFAHREPGIIGAAFDANRLSDAAPVSVEIICDGLHIHPSVVRACFKLFGRNMVLISDSLRCTGMPDGEYTLGGQPITMSNGRATLSGTQTLAGSSIHLMEAVRRAVSFGIPLEQAVYAASTAPAKSIGIAAGRICTGENADLVLIDSSINVVKVFIDGQEILADN